MTSDVLYPEEHKLYTVERVTKYDYQEEIFEDDEVFGEDLINQIIKLERELNDLKNYNYKWYFPEQEVLKDGDEFTIEGHYDKSNPKKLQKFIAREQ